MATSQCSIQLFSPSHDKRYEHNKSCICSKDLIDHIPHFDPCLKAHSPKLHLRRAAAGECCSAKIRDFFNLLHSNILLHREDPLSSGYGR